MPYLPFCRAMLGTHIIAICAVVLWGFGSPLYAQKTPPAGVATDTVLRTQPESWPLMPTTLSRDTITQSSDTLFRSTKAAQTTTAPDTTQPKQRYSPKKALRWSLLPGGGQIYNQQYWKAPLIIGAFSGALTMTIKRKLDYNHYYQQYTAELTNLGIGLPATLTSEELADLRGKKQRALRDYNHWRVATAVVYGVNLLDAFASAYVRNDRKAHSPVKAAYYSAILPGLGQAYNRKYWKIPIVYGGFAAAGYIMYTNGNNMQRATKEYLARTRPGYGDLDPALAIYSDSRLLQIRGIYKRYYELSIIVASVWYILNIIDATADAHLNDFDISDDLGWQVKPYFDTGGNAAHTNTLPALSNNYPITHSGLTFVWQF